MFGVRRKRIRDTNRCHSAVRFLESAVFQDRSARWHASAAHRLTLLNFRICHYLYSEEMNWTKLLSTTRTRQLVGGRPSENPEAKWRSEFERDYDRAVFSTPVRRLQDKAQVYPLEQNDGVRTRLTHSHEVANVARSLTKPSLIEISEETSLTHPNIDNFATIAATCGLLHDVGNPPFGHAGEQAMIDWFVQDDGQQIAAGLAGRPELLADLKNFDGNAQTIRLITRLQVLNDESGLNLTCGTLAVATKYIATSLAINKDVQQLGKLGVFFSEADLIKNVRTEVGLSDNQRHPVTFLVEAADDIVYSSVDLEDGLRKGDLNWRTLISELEKRNGSDDPFLRAVFEGVVRQLDIGNDSTGDEKLTSRVRRLDERFAADVLGQVFRVNAIAKVVPAVRKLFVQRFQEIDAGTYSKELIADPLCEGFRFVQSCKEIARKHVFPSREILQLELMGRRIIFDLMSYFWLGASKGTPDSGTKTFPEKTYNLISRNYRNVAEKEIANLGQSTTPMSPEEIYHRAKLVMDYIAGMTDTFALNLHRRLFNG